MLVGLGAIVGVVSAVLLLMTNGALLNDQDYPRQVKKGMTSSMGLVMANVLIASGQGWSDLNVIGIIASGAWLVYWLVIWRAELRMKQHTHTLRTEEK